MEPELDVLPATCTCSVRVMDELLLTLPSTFKGPVRETLVTELIGPDSGILACFSGVGWEMGSKGGSEPATEGSVGA